MAKKWEEVEFTLTNEEVEFLLSKGLKDRADILCCALDVYKQKKEQYREILKISESKERTKATINSKKLNDMENLYLEKYIKGYTQNNGNYEWYLENIDGQAEKELISSIIGQYSLDYSYGFFDCNLMWPERIRFYILQDWINQKKPIFNSFYVLTDGQVSDSDIELFNEIIKIEIKKLDYKTFLDTAYWKLVAKKTKEHYKNKCVVCDSEKNLNAHHKNYKRHGEEHLYYKQDLVCLCNKCHQKYHEVGE